MKYLLIVLLFIGCKHTPYVICPSPSCDKDYILRLWDSLGCTPGFDFAVCDSDKEFYSSSATIIVVTDSAKYVLNPPPTNFEKIVPCNTPAGDRAVKANELRKEYPNGVMYHLTDTSEGRVKDRCGFIDGESVVWTGKRWLNTSDVAGYKEDQNYVVSSIISSPNGSRIIFVEQSTRPEYPADNYYCTNSAGSTILRWKDNSDTIYVKAGVHIIRLPEKY